MLVFGSSGAVPGLNDRNTQKLRTRKSEVKAGKVKGRHRAHTLSPTSANTTPEGILQKMGVNFKKNNENDSRLSFHCFAFFYCTNVTAGSKVLPFLIVGDVENGFFSMSKTKKCIKKGPKTNRVPKFVPKG